MTTYLFLAFLSLVVLKFGRNPFIYWTFFCILVILAGGRGFATGGDTWFYSWTFNDVANGRDFASVSGIKFPEYGYYWLNKAVILLGGNYRIFLFVDAILSLFPIFYVARKYTLHPHYVVAFYVLLYFYCFFLCFTRQYFAIGLLFIGYVRLAQKDDIKGFILLVVLATLFHNSSPLALTILLFRKRKYHPMIGACFLIGSYIIGRSGLIDSVTYWFVGFSSFSGYLERATDASYSINGLLLVIFFSWFLAVNKNKSLYCHIIVFGLTVFNLLMFESDLARVAWNFTIVEPLLFGDMKFTKRKAIVLPVLTIFSLLVFANFLNANQGKVVPYNFTLKATSPLGFDESWIGERNE